MQRVTFEAYDEDKQKSDFIGAVTVTLGEIVGVHRGVYTAVRAWLGAWLEAWLGRGWRRCWDVAGAWHRLKGMVEAEGGAEAEDGAKAEGGAVAEGGAKERKPVDRRAERVMGERERGIETVVWCACKVESGSE